MPYTKEFMKLKVNAFYLWKTLNLKIKLINWLSDFTVQCIGSICVVLLTVITTHMYTGN